MGNTLMGAKKKTVKVMKITGETMKLKAPVKAGDVVKNYPGFVLLESEAVKHYGIRAKPLEAEEKLSPQRLYFMVEIPKVECLPRRVRSGINMTAKDRLDSLMLARRSTSDLSLMKLPDGGGDSGRRVKLRLPKAQVERLLNESTHEGDAAEKMIKLFMETTTETVSQNARIKPPQKRVSFMAVREAETQIPVASY